MTKKKIFVLISAVMIATIAAMNVKLNQSIELLSDLILANVTALAESEGGNGGDSGLFPTTQKVTDYIYEDGLLVKTIEYYNNRIL